MINLAQKIRNRYLYKLQLAGVIYDLLYSITEKIAQHKSMYVRINITQFGYTLHCYIVNNQLNIRYAPGGDIPLQTCEGKESSLNLIKRFPNKENVILELQEKLIKTI
jgi:hypothetical protein